MNQSFLHNVWILKCVIEEIKLYVLLFIASKNFYSRSNTQIHISFCFSSYLLALFKYLILILCMYKIIKKTYLESWLILVNSLSRLSIYQPEMLLCHSLGTSVLYLYLISLYCQFCANRISSTLWKYINVGIFYVC